ncbi:MAG: prolyl oligopeptidase family serine peptidase [Limisphaerales bacterium]
MKKFRLLIISYALIILIINTEADVSPKPSNAAKEDRHVVYGNYSGLALLMDVYYPKKPNGYGVVQISGSGFTRPLSLDAALLSDWRAVKFHSEPLLDAGYTIFALNHRMTPRFKYPAQIADAQRAVRFIRYNAKKYNINPDKIGAIGESSGGYLASMLGLLKGYENKHDDNPINKLSAKVQCVVALCSPMNLLDEIDVSFYLGFRKKEQLIKGSIEHQISTEASPISHVSIDDSPMLLIHSRSDEKVDYSHSVEMHNKLKHKGVLTKLIEINGADHEFFISGNRVESFTEDFVKWMDIHLTNKPSNANVQ